MTKMAKILINLSTRWDEMASRKREENIFVWNATRQDTETKTKLKNINIPSFQGQKHGYAKTIENWNT